MRHTGPTPAPQVRNDVHVLTQTVGDEASTWAWAPLHVADYRLRPPACPAPLKVNSSKLARGIRDPM
jgi:hypothetical protein